MNKFITIELYFEEGFRGVVVSTFVSSAERPRFDPWSQHLTIFFIYFSLNIFKVTFSPFLLVNKGIFAYLHIT